MLKLNIPMELPPDLDKDELFHCKNDTCGQEFSPIIFPRTHQELAIAEGQVAIERCLFKCPTCSTIYKASTLTLLQAKLIKLPTIFINSPKPIKWGINVAAS